MAKTILTYEEWVAVVEKASAELTICKDRLARRKEESRCRKRAHDQAMRQSKKNIAFYQRTDENDLRTKKKQLANAEKTLARLRTVSHEPKPRIRMSRPPEPAGEAKQDPIETVPIVTENAVVQLRLRVTRSEKLAMEAAAKLSGLDMSSWLREIWNQGVVLSQPKSIC